MRPPQIDRYELFEPPLGEGSYGVVYRARFNGLDERAVKVFKRGLLDFDVLRRELEKLAKAKHGGIVVLYDFDLTGETPYYAMGLHAQKDERGKWVGRTLEGVCGKVEVKEAVRACYASRGSRFASACTIAVIQ